MQHQLPRNSRARNLPLVVSCVVVCLAFALLSIVLVDSAGADVSIGLYSDGGTTCSFSGNNSGLVTAHVVVRSNGQGIRGVRFAAPIPGCFDASFVADIVPYGITAIGESQTGISLAIPYCETSPIHVLDIQYIANGNTTPCCEFPIVPESTVGFLEAVDCAFGSVQMTAKTSYMNADASCDCRVPEIPPYPPMDANPVDGATYQPLELVLRWTATDPNNFPLTCDLYLGTNVNPPLVAADMGGAASWAYNPPRLSSGTTYYWRVLVRNSGGGETSGPVWSFSTGPNQLPSVYLSQPGDGAVGVSMTPVLKWLGYDDTALTYDVYLGTTAAPPRVAGGTTATQYTPPVLAFATTYWWRVIARDIDGGEGSSTTWAFTTKARNEPPNVPSNPSPAVGATNVSINVSLAWQCTDPEGQALNYDIYFGSVADPPLVASNRTSRFYTLPVLQVETTYFWRIVARDTGGLTQSGPVWSFATRHNQPPGTPSNPTPPNGSTGRIVTTPILWQCSDPDQQSLWFDVYWGTTSPPPLVATNVSTKSYNPANQAYLTKYYWRVVARDPVGAETSGPTWSYTTKGTNDPPNAPSIPQPGNGATGQPVNVKVSWQASDPENDALNFDIYFGTDASPPLVADHITSKNYDPGLLAISTVYRWKVVARDALGQETSSALWSFTTANTSNIPPFVPSSPTPRDGGTASTSPMLAWQGGDPDGDVVQYTVWMFTWDTFPDYLGTTTDTHFQVQQNLAPGFAYTWYISAFDGHWTVSGPLWSFGVGGGGVPVAFKAFSAKPSGAVAEIRWELSSDEPMESYSLYRRDGTAGAPRVVTEGPVAGARDSYLDKTVEPGKTYGYEIIIHAEDGNDFRSSIATVTMPSLELTLYQNQPNPFNPQTTIRYDLPGNAGPMRVRLSIVDLAGRRVRTLVDEVQAAGSRSAVWNGRDDHGNAVASGVYFYVLDASKQRVTRKLVLLK